MHHHKHTTLHKHYIQCIQFLSNVHIVQVGTACVNQTFGAGKKIEEAYLVYQFGGVIGLGVDTMGQITPLFNNMIKQLKVAPYFGLYLSS